MLAKRLPLLSAFAVGCLSGAALLASWRPGHEHTATTTTARAPERNLELVELAFADALAQERDSPNGEATAVKHPEELGADVATETGASAADVLLRLEAQYRQGLATPPAPVAETAVVSAPERAATALATTAVAAAPPATLPAVAPPTGAASPPAVAAAPVDAATVTRPASAQPLGAPVAPSPDAPPREAVAVSRVQQNIHVGDVHQGDVYQLQQLAFLQQYMQLLGLSSYGALAPSGAAPPRGTRRRAAAFPTNLTNPDNPWGFDFPPTVLVK